jgi:thiamine-monophosphate kinase
MPTSEATLIRKLRMTATRIARGNVPTLALGIGDDAALYHPRHGYESIVTCDWFLEGTHFLPDQHPPDAVGWKALARAVSDIAAMGGEPRCFLLSLALPTALSGRWLDQFLIGLRRASAKLKCTLAGGDTTRYQRVLINITVVGEVRANGAVLRSTAKPGDIIFVSGRLGEAELGFRLWRTAAQRRRSRRGKSKVSAGDSGQLVSNSLQSLLRSMTETKVSVNPGLRKHLYPEPRLRLAKWLAKHKLVSAMMDLSDGLSSDLPRLCKASGVGAQIDAAKIPVTTSKQAVGSKFDALSLALNGGDDYELLFTVPRARSNRVPHSFEGVALTAIGEITRNRLILLAQPGGRPSPLKARGWDPFK